MRKSLHQIFEFLNKLNTRDEKKIGGEEDYIIKDLKGTAKNKSPKTW